MQTELIFQPQGNHLGLTYMAGKHALIVMLMKLAANTQANVAYVVHRAARFTNRPKHSHPMEIRSIRHLKNTKDIGMRLRPIEISSNHSM